jgi:hypothetical protein
MASSIDKDKDEQARERDEQSMIEALKDLE